ncbi:MAG: EAL domain-containing protein [Candidatus Korobacteraceae bacterium]
MRFVARQPVFLRTMALYGYEILFRSGFESAANFSNADDATRLTLDNSILWGLERLCGDKLAFVNCTRSVLVNRLIELLPPSQTVVEVLEDVLPDREVLEACRSLKEKGYRIALDDVVCLRDVEAYLPLADIVKVDFRLASRVSQATMAYQLHQRGILALAEKVEDREEHSAAMHMGYELFQGFFFQRPEVVQRRNIELHSNTFRLLRAAQEPELDLKLIEELIRSEPSLSLRLLHYLNSVAFAFRIRVTSIRHGLSLLGEEETRKWLIVSAVTENCCSHPLELITWALVRARFCELTANKLFDVVPGAFWLGMVSAFPALLETTVENLLQRMPVASAVSEALLGAPGIYRDLLDVMIAYERGQWAQCAELAGKLRLSEGSVSAIYIESTQWANTLTGVNTGKNSEVSSGT